MSIFNKVTLILTFGLTASWAQAATEIHMVQQDGIELETMIQYPEASIATVGTVFFSRGSGTGDMRSYVDGFFERFLEQTFLPRGYAIVYQNKRGIGASSGNWTRGSIEQRAEDMLAVIDFYRTLPSANTQRVGIVGHSQGGWVVQHAAAVAPQLDFVISLAAPLVTVAESDIERTRYMYQCEGVSGEKLQRKMNKRLRHHKRMMALGSWLPYFEMRFMHNILPFNPMEALVENETPMLIALAGMDSMAIADSNLQRLHEGFPDGLPEHLTVMVEPDTDHFFRKTDSYCIDWEADTVPLYSETFLAQYRTWIDER